MYYFPYVTAMTSSMLWINYYLQKIIKVSKGLSEQLRQTNSKAKQMWHTDNYAQETGKEREREGEIDDSSASSHEKDESHMYKEGSQLQLSTARGMTWSQADDKKSRILQLSNPIPSDKNNFRCK